jgi:glutathione S-transferase
MKVVNEEFPKFIEKVEAGLGKMKWMAGDKLSIADFWVGAWYCDWATNEKSSLLAAWAPILMKYPNLCRWGEDFKRDNCVWLSTRPESAY